MQWVRVGLKTNEAPRLKGKPLKRLETRLFSVVSLGRLTLSLPFAVVGRTNVTVVIFFTDWVTKRATFSRHYAPPL